MYRRDLESGKVTIEFITGNNSKQLSFTPYEPLSYKGEVWKKNIDFTFEFKKKAYKVKGFVGILKDRKSGGKGSFDSAGFALFRRNRVIVGGEGLNYMIFLVKLKVQFLINYMAKLIWKIFL